MFLTFFYFFSNLVQCTKTSKQNEKRFESRDRAVGAHNLHERDKLHSHTYYAIYYTAVIWAHIRTEWTRIII